MLHLVTYGVDDALAQATDVLLNPRPTIETTEQDSRNGPVVRFKGVSVLEHRQPEQKVCLNKSRNANPFFHIVEALWMLAGRNDLATLQRFIADFGQYSDDGKTLHGAYGYRWRYYYGYDQLEWIIEELRDNPESRRCVLQMWDGGRTDNQDDSLHPVPIEGSGDLYHATHGGRDAPCNLCVLFDATNGTTLDMTVFNRSNDLVWGALGANYVHFAMLQEYVASCLNMAVGVYYQVSNNLHVYTKKHGPEMLARIHTEVPNTPKVKLVECCIPDLHNEWARDTFLRDVDLFVDMCRDGKSFLDSGAPFAYSFIRNTCKPMVETHELYKLGKIEEALNYARFHVKDPQWSAGAVMWLENRCK